MSRLGDLIHLERTRRNMTAKQVARLCSLSEKYLLDVEQGRRIIADDQARRILRRIGLEQQTEADFSLDDIAATVDLHTAAPTLPQRPVEDKPRPVASLPAEDSEHGGIWLDALASVLRQVPVYNAAWQIVDHRTLAAAGGKIEGGPADKALYFLAPDDSMRGLSYPQGRFAAGRSRAQPHRRGGDAAEVEKPLHGAQGKAVRRAADAAQLRPGAGRAAGAAGGGDVRGALCAAGSVAVIRNTKARFV